jgi:hypothetical protein
LSDGVGHRHPHLMFFVPETNAVNWGADLPGSPILGLKDTVDLPRRAEISNGFESLIPYDGHPCMISLCDDNSLGICSDQDFRAELTNVPFRYRIVVGPVEKDQQAVRLYLTPQSGANTKEFLAFEYGYTRKR